MLVDLHDIENKVNAQLSEWLQREEAIIIECRGQTLTDSRYWKCDLGEGEWLSSLVVARMPVT